MMTRMKRSYSLKFISLSLLVILWGKPVSAAFASSNQHASAQKTVTASAVIVPAQVSELGFLISGIAREIPVKEGDAVKAGQTLMTLDTPDLQYAVTEAEAALRSVQAEAVIQSYRRVKNQRNGRIFYDVVPAVYRQRVEAKVQQAQVALELAQINLAEGTLLAPSDGIVASLSVIPGEFVQADQGVVTIATLNNLQVETTDLTEHDITKVKIGSSATISVEALDQTINGKVISISPIADTVGGDVVYRVTIAFDEQPEGLLWGMTAEISINE